MTCCYCGEERHLIKAHIIPEGFICRMRNGSGDLKRISGIKKEYPKRAPIGPYDATILCAACEQYFGEWDDYAQKILSVNPKGTPVISAEGMILEYQIAEYRYDLLKLFFISLVWRASVATEPFYKNVSLGGYESTVKNHLRRGDPGNAHEFAVLVKKWDDHLLAKAIYNPFRERFDGINYYTFYLGEYVGHVKVDRRDSVKEFSEFILAPNRPLKILTQNLTESKDLRAMQGILAMPQNQRTRR